MAPKEYADKRGVTLQAITKAIREGHNLPSVKRVQKFGRFYLLTVTVDKKGNLK